MVDEIIKAPLTGYSDERNQNSVEDFVDEQPDEKDELVPVQIGEDEEEETENDGEAEGNFSR